MIPGETNFYKTIGRNYGRSTVPESGQIVEALY